MPTIRLRWTNTSRRGYPVRIVRRQLDNGYLIEQLVIAQDVRERQYTDEAPDGYTYQYEVVSCYPDGELAAPTPAATATVDLSRKRPNYASGLTVETGSGHEKPEPETGVPISPFKPMPSWAK